MDWLDRVKGGVRSITGVGLALIPVGLLTQALFGNPSLIPGDILANLMGLISALGDNGLIGLIALAIVLWLFRGQTSS